MPRMTPQNMRMGETLDRRGYVRTENERLSTREHASLGLPDTCTIQTRTVTDTVQGGQSETWADSYTGVRCWLSGTGTAWGEERLFAGRLIHQADGLLRLPHSQALSVTDRITNIAGPDGVVRDAGPFEVLATGKAPSEQNFTQALLRRVA